MLEYLRGPLQEGRYKFPGHAGMSLTDGYFWAQRGGGYGFYLGRNSASNIDFEHPIALCGPVNQLLLPAVFGASGQYYLACKTVSRFGLQSDDYALLNIYVDGQLDGYAAPGSPFDFYARALSGSRVLLAWRYEPAAGSAQLLQFKIFTDNGSGTIDYQTPIGQVLFRPAGKCYRWISDQLDDNKFYRFVVQAYSAEGICDGNGDYLTIKPFSTISASVQAVTLQQQD